MKKIKLFLEQFAMRPEIGTSKTQIETQTIGGLETNFYINEFWTSRQRQVSRLHEIAYRACFKAQLPRFFIQELAEPDQRVYDPFCGRGTTLVEAALMGRPSWGNDINPLSKILTEPRLNPPDYQEVEKRLKTVPKSGVKSDIDLSMFFEARTLEEISSLRSCYLEKSAAGMLDNVDRWIQMVATNRLTGHSPGFFSVYTLPPNQAASPRRQTLINQKRKQKPVYRNTHSLILKKSKTMLTSLSATEWLNLRNVAKDSAVFTGDARNSPFIPSSSVQLTVTSPPFLNIVQYKADNWMRCWFNGLDSDAIGGNITSECTPVKWGAVMKEVLRELYRITQPGGWVAFEVGEVRGGSIFLDHQIIKAGVDVGFQCEGVVVNQQIFTKTSNIWGVENNRMGTNSNRIVLMTKVP